MNAPQRVTVHWRDINTHNGGWEAIADARNASLADCQTTGYLIAETDDRVTIAANWGHDDSGNEEINLSTCIPRGCVVRIEKLES